MTPLTRKCVQLWLAWCAAHGLSVGTFIWLLASLERQSILNGGSTAIAVLFSVGVIACIQQVLLRSAGWSARWWWIATYLGIVVGTLVGVVVPVGFLLSTFACGMALGAVQMRSCEQLCKWPILWPIFTGFGVTAGATQFLLAMSSPGASIDPFRAYLIGLAAGASYGAFTGIGLAVHIDGSESPDSFKTGS